ncbi:SGNH/GDSL hydrolase family protein [Amycolatopsis sp. FBCC-B4732]|uniref:SGNH/GDSL hydrolase family protein n=1 Tax=Amycolatopsis sp. FBCC-B4732 TaxID=3079339 RepID=UPI001FF463A3|nr:SGNH/GDSL hydrolase family protein [Amycolatopsis sp. FBCC-B4732]UOX91648.1 SGNH/GDSL hydrolase family protein [Amycolatopsis sp. FBCC-B4732]
MTITLKPHSTVLFTGDSITDLWRPEGEDRCAYPALAAGEWCFRHPSRPITWRNTAHAGNTVPDLEARWRTDVLDARPDLVSILVGVNDNGRHTFHPHVPEVSADEFAAGYDRLLAPLAATGTQLILIEPFLIPVHGDVEAGIHRAGEAEEVIIGDDVRQAWRAGLDPKIRAVRELAHEYGAALLAADRMFAELSAAAGAEHWSEDGVHPTPAGHGALAQAWLDLVA